MGKQEFDNALASFTDAFFKFTLLKADLEGFRFSTSEHLLPTKELESLTLDLVTMVQKNQLDQEQRTELERMEEAVSKKRHEREAHLHDVLNTITSTKRRKSKAPLKPPAN